ncbi:MAG: PcfJ domain-containing protein [Bacteroidota bacterium]
MKRNEWTQLIQLPVFLPRLGSFLYLIFGVYIILLLSNFIYEIARQEGFVHPFTLLFLLLFFYALKAFIQGIYKVLSNPIQQEEGNGQEVRTKGWLKKIALQRAYKNWKNQPQMIWGLFLQPSYVEEVLRYQDEYIRHPGDWQIPDHVYDHLLLMDLLSHLFEADHKVPKAIHLAAQSMQTAKAIGWFVQASQGVPLRKLQGFPIPLTKRMEQALLHSRFEFTFPIELRRAEIKGLGGSRELIDAVALKTEWSDFEYPTFWRSVWTYLIHHDIRNKWDVDNIIGYIQTIKFEKPFYDEFGDPIPLEITAHPRFEITGRNVNKLLREATVWSEKVHQLDLGMQAVWAQSIQPLHLSLPQGGTVGILPLLTKRDLYQEGEAMNHCVAEYASDCIVGTSSIWSMRSNPHTVEEERLLTIEIHEPDCIVQALGHDNRPAKPQELVYLKEWAKENTLRLSLES